VLNTQPFSARFSPASTPAFIHPAIFSWASLGASARPLRSIGSSSAAANSLPGISPIRAILATIGASSALGGLVTISEASSLK